jgi:hypothetical protein
MAKRILNRKDLRADYDAAERRKVDEEEQEEGEEEVETDEDEEEAPTDEEGGDEDEGEEDEEAEKPKKRKPAAKPKATKAKPRSRSAKVTRMKVVWGVFNNSNQCVATFDYPRRKDADDLVAKLTAEKKNTHFIQPVKEPIEEKKEK